MLQTQGRRRVRPKPNSQLIFTAIYCNKQCQLLILGGLNIAIGIGAIGIELHQYLNLNRINKIYRNYYSVPVFQVLATRGCYCYAPKLDS